MDGSGTVFGVGSGVGVGIGIGVGTGVGVGVGVGTGVGCGVGVGSAKVILGAMDRIAPVAADAFKNSLRPIFFFIIITSLWDFLFFPFMGANVLFLFLKYAVPSKWITSRVPSLNDSV